MRIDQSRNSIVNKNKDRSSSVEPKRLIHRKIPSNCSKYESKLAYYANLLNDFKEKNPKCSKVASYSSKSKNISHRGIF